jgi:beta-glucosidase
MKLFFTTINILITLLIVSSCNQESMHQKSSDAIVSAKADSILSQMTLEEKVGQMCQITLDVLTNENSGHGHGKPAELDTAMVKLAFGKYKVGSVLNTVNSRAQTLQWWNETIAYLQQVAEEETGIPLIYGIDAIHGVNYTAEATLFPQQIGQAATFNPELVRKINALCAYEMRASNIPWTFSPVQDMGRDPRDPRFWETYGEDVYLAGQLGAAATLGLQGTSAGSIDKNHGAACLKHFLANNSNSGKDRNPLEISVRNLKEKHAASFQPGIDAGAKTIMLSSGIINGLPTHANYEIVTRLLRDEMGFNGMVLTDWKDVENFYSRDKIAASSKEAVKIGINAGIDMVMVPYDLEFCDHLIALVNEGEVSMERIDEAVRRILILKIELGLFDRPNTFMEDYPKFKSADFEKLAYETALESITLLKNSGDILPLDKYRKVLVAGPNAHTMRPMNGGWSYSWQGHIADEFAGEHNTFLEAIQQKIDKQNVKYVEGVSYKMDGKYHEEENINIPAAVRAAQNVDCVILFLGENSYCEKPGDLNDLYISGIQAQLAHALANTGKPVILVLNEGRPRIISKFEDKMAAVLQTYLPSNYGGDALADILFGDENPSGKLPYTYPKYPNALITYDFKHSEHQENKQGAYDYSTHPEMQYEFGDGLSYTTFEYNSFSVDKDILNPGEEIKVSAAVKNTGDKTGKEVVLLFYSDLVASIAPDNKNLCRFSKVALEPGASATIEFVLTPKDFAFYNYDNQQVAEKGEFILKIKDFEHKFTLSKTIAFDNPSKLKL